MKKKLWAIFLTGMMVLSMTACGDKAAKEETKTEQAAETSAEAAPAKEEGATKEADTAQAAEESSDENSLKDLEGQMAEAYMGVTDAGEGFYYAGNEDGTFAIILVADPNTKETASFVGECEQVSDTQLTITDDESGNTLTFGVAPQEDGTLQLDLGDLGKAVIEKCEISDVLDAMQTINDHGIAVI